LNGFKDLDNMRLGADARAVLHIAEQTAAGAATNEIRETIPLPINGQSAERSPNGQLFRNERCVAICDDVF
jgi:hypothetical protein